MREPISPDEAERRLQVIFPRAAFDSVLSSPLAGMAVAACIHVDAVCSSSDDPDIVEWARPSTVVWMSSEALSRTSDADRLAWRTAAAKGSKQVEDLHTHWGVPFQPKYKDNSRETLRDETFRKWREHGALRMRPGLPTSSSKPRWALLNDFADLFNPSLTEEDFEQSADEWREKHLDPGTRLRAIHALDTETAAHAVTVTLPNNTTRTLEPGHSSKIIKGVIETWAPARLVQPVVLTISEPGDKVHIGDERTLRALGINIDLANVLPDAVIADIGADPVHFWIIEAVASDGPVSEERRKALLAWAAQQNIKAERCSFLTAFLSRNHAAAKKRLKDIASGTWAWFADEPGHELAWYKVVPTSDGL
ncbi:restriction endonuclease [Amycolatopsis thailandensis]|uniref:Restriction endonuclease n=1 Tax=Amycolatopsis thailandensis TaxID=589330 RepID=A0A229SF81_9PSEU|nr:BsuBI/PstI family type II restriction endonuclease [Amycolatopsis thailandensis]OXM57587.1 restriction endonuclease [Amycolatopsis thailandensis]